MITITISGPDNVGTSILMSVLHQYLENHGCQVIEPNEPHAIWAEQALRNLGTGIKIVQELK